MLPQSSGAYNIDHTFIEARELYDGMDRKDRSLSYVPYHSRTKFLLIGIITTGILFVFTLEFNQNHTVMAQQQGLNGTSFQIGNTTFFHQLASVNGIQLHYVIGGT